MRRRTALGLPLLLTVSAGLTRSPRANATAAPWSRERANRWHQGQGWLVGANFITSTAVNQLEMFQRDTFDLRRIDIELAWAAAAGLNAVRVFLHDQLWAQDHRGFQYRLAQFVAVAARHRIKPLFVFFDSCWDPLPRSGPQLPPRPGVHNSRWVQSPGAERIDDRAYRRTLYDYVVGVMTQFRYDNRVLGWDLWNEPDNPADEYRSVERPDKLARVTELLPEVFGWARSVDVTQPITCGVWAGSAPAGPIAEAQRYGSDVLSMHCYEGPHVLQDRIDELLPLERPVLCTEYLARTRGSTIDHNLPVLKRAGVGAFNWGLVAGRTQTYLPWDSWQHPYPAVPKVWFHDLLQPTGRPFREVETLTISNLSRA